jgi:leucyl aminopeptidase
MRCAQSSTAAAFLSNFVNDEKKWVHFDIAWTAMRELQKQPYDLDNHFWTWASIHLVLEYILKK